jgi:tight adherence protein B
MSAYVLTGIPLFVIGALVIVSPDYLTPLIVDPRGNIIIGVAVLSVSIGFATIRQMLRGVTEV